MMFPNINECRNIIRKQIRNDTYIFMKRMDKGENYEDIYKDLNENREKYSIKKDLWLSAEDTCKKYLKIIYESLGKEDNVEEEVEVKIIDNSWRKKTGVYCIKVNNNIVYIGQTIVGFQDRFKAHKRKVEDKNENGYLYKLLRGAKNTNKCVCFEPIIIIEDLEIREKRKFSKKEIDIMELTLIQAYQPIGNIRGRLSPYY